MNNLFDLKGKVVVMTNPDGSLTERSHNVSKGISAGLNSSGKSVWGNEIEIMGQ